MKIAILSDIHANLPALQTVADHIAHSHYDAVYCLGDIGGYASRPNEVQELLAGKGWPTVLGNYDEGVGFQRDDCGCHYVKPFDIAMSNVSFLWTRERTTDPNKAWLRELPREIRFEADGRRVLLCHGSPRSTTEYLFENRSDGFLKQFTPGGNDDAQADIIVFGHTHVPFHRVVEGIHFVNSGSVGRPKDGDPRAGYCVLTLENGSLSTEQVRLAYDVEAAARSLVEEGLPEYFADYLRTGGSVTPEHYDADGRRLPGFVPGTANA
ncbi:MAG: metallophosphoesterase family protein [Capsulimonadales bacterium]|nr:metallophosphoesterase family protein [Capsulimonadales bacterium]